MLARGNLGSLVLLMLLVTSVFAAVTLGSPTRTRGDSLPGRTAQAAGHAGLQARLDGLVTVLARLEERAGCPHATRAAGSSLEEPWAELRGELETLAHGIAALETQVGDLRRDLRPQAGLASAPHGELATLRETRPEADWYSLDQIVATWSRDRDEARETLRFLSPAQLLERFGTPTRVRGEDEGEVRWTYGPAADDPARAYRVSLSLHDGYVTNANVYSD